METRREPLRALGFISWMLAMAPFVIAIANARADEAPIAGVVKAVDVGAQTFIVESTAQGKTRQVTIYMKPTSRVVRFVRADQGRGPLVEQAAALADLKPGWMVSVTTVHEGDREVAQLVRIVLER
jgi:predicted transcriptional regulator